MEQFAKDGNALTDPPVHIDWRDFVGFFGAETHDPQDLDDYHLTNYQAIIVKLHATWDANKASAHANAELITRLRKKIKKAKKALRN